MGRTELSNGNLKRSYLRTLTYVRWRPPPRTVLYRTGGDRICAPRAGIAQPVQDVLRSRVGGLESEREDRSIHPSVHPSIRPIQLGAGRTRMGMLGAGRRHRVIRARVHDQRRARDAIQRCRSERTEVVLHAPPTSLRTERRAKRRLQLRCAAGDRREQRSAIRRDSLGLAAQYEEQCSERRTGRVGQYSFALVILPASTVAAIPYGERLAGRLAGNALASRCGSGARTRTSDGGKDSINGCTGSAYEERDRGGPASRAGYHKALTACTLPVTGSPQRPLGQQVVSLLGVSALGPAPASGIGALQAPRP